MLNVNKNKSLYVGYKKTVFAVSLVLTSYLTGCSSITNHPYEPQDPLQTVNRATFAFNNQFDRFILKPLATGYKKITPTPVRDGVNNFYWNLAEIPTTINNILQLKPKAALDSFGRLAINSTVGILGIFDVAKHAGLERKDNDFGITMATYGFTSSPYFVIPFLGPSNFRDGLGMLVDYDPFSIFPYIQSVRLRNVLLGVDYVRIRANFLDNEDVLKVAALDKYTLVRDAYIQRREMQMAQQGVSWDQAKYYELAEDDLSIDDYWAIDGTENVPTAVEPPLKASDKSINTTTQKSTSAQNNKAVSDEEPVPTKSTVQPAKERFIPIL